MPKQSNLVKLGDAINQLFKQENLDTKISQFSIKNNWKTIAGQIVANYTSEINFQRTTLFLTITSDAIRHELSLQKEKLIDEINKYCDYNIINQIVLK
ncbi:MAG: DUF721 domain-containing protein [Bacteroidetes bacterium]|nr:DUF721 domain-containing protein [Bacteroidota bacterium]